MDKESNWWVHCVTSNYASRWYRYTIVDIMAFQKLLESELFTKSRVAETAALAEWTERDSVKASAVLQEFQESAARTVRERWWEFFFSLVGTFRDMYKVVDPHTENFNQAFRYLTVPRYFIMIINDNK